MTQPTPIEKIARNRRTNRQNFATFFNAKDVTTVHPA